MMGIGFPELMIILVIIMIIFGAGKLPEIGSAFGRSIKNFKTSMKEAQEAEKLEEGQDQPQVAEGQPQAAGDQQELSDEEKERLAREKAQAEGEAKDKAMKEAAAAFTSTLPRKGSYDFAKDQEEQAAKKEQA